MGNKSKAKLWLRVLVAQFAPRTHRPRFSFLVGFLFVAVLDVVVVVFVFGVLSAQLAQSEFKLWFGPVAHVEGFSVRLGSARFGSFNGQIS